MITPNAKLLEMLAALITAELDGGSLRLFKNDFVPNENSVAGDFTVADFTGYANVAVATWGTPYLDDLARPTTLGGLRTFAQTGTAVNNVVYGVYYLNATNELVWAERFAEPFAFAGTGTTLPIVPKYQLGNKDAPGL